MALSWESETRSSGKLKIFNAAGDWSGDVGKAIAKFKLLSFPVELTTVTEAKHADVVIKLSSGPDSYEFSSEKYEGVTVKTAADFKPEVPHGSTVAVFAEVTPEILFAVIFLPGKLGKTNAGVKEAIITHELIHACGMVSKEKDRTKNKNESHDNEGIMYDIMTTTSTGLVEGSRSKGKVKRSMPPIRVGTKTRNVLNAAWS